MVWAVSHDTADAKYSQLLGEAARRKFTAVMQLGSDEGTGTDDGYEYVADYKQQCQWTGCNDSESP